MFSKRPLVVDVGEVLVEQDLGNVMLVARREGGERAWITKRYALPNSATKQGEVGHLRLPRWVAEQISWADSV